MKIDEVTAIMITSFPEESDPLVGVSVGVSVGGSVSAIPVYFRF
jgi:hypothetical protein